MFYETCTLRKLIPTQTKARNGFAFVNEISLQKKNSKLSCRIGATGGRDCSGRTIIRTRGALRRKFRSPIVNLTNRYRYLGLLASFQFIFAKNRLVSLIYFANGSLVYHFSTSNHSMFSYIYETEIKRMRAFLKTKVASLICYLKRLTTVCVLELAPGRGAQYCISPGTSSRIFSFDQTLKTALIELPSDTKKLFSIYSYVFCGNVSLRNKKQYRNTRAGHWRALGIKALSRGVAKNPVDHPHGGRTKAIRYQRTPWGKTAKYK